MPYEISSRQEGLSYIDEASHTFGISRFLCLSERQVRKALKYHHNQCMFQ